MVKTFVVKPSNSLDTTDVHTLFHISCFQQSKLTSEQLVFFVFSVSLLFYSKDQAVQKKQILKGMGMNQ